MKKWMGIMAALALAGMLAGCMPPVGGGGGSSSSATAGSGQGGAAAASSSAASTPADVASPAAAEGGELAVFLPTGQEALAAVLQQVAEAEGAALQFVTAPAGTAYQRLAAEALAAETPPALVWVENAAAAEALAFDGLVFDLAGPAAGEAGRAMAAMVAPGLAAGVDGGCPGLPVGFYGQGYVVNLGMLATLLNAGDMAVLQEDLAACSWQEWQALAEAVSGYLAQPKRVAVTLNGNTYTMPRYRPEAAQGVRAMFTLATEEGGAFAETALATALAAAFENAADYESGLNAARAERMDGPLWAMLAALALETAHLAWPGGAGGRGEEAAARPAVSAEEAEALLQSGTALCMRGDTRLAARLDAESPAQSGGFAVIPIKLPLEDREMLARVQNRLLVQSGGYLCVAAGPQAQQATALLLRLFASEKGMAWIEDELGLLPFARAYPRQAVPGRLARAVALGQWAAPPLGPAAMEKAEAAVGETIRTELMAKEEWGEAEEEAVIAAAHVALGILLVGDGAPGEAQAP